MEESEKKEKNLIVIGGKPPSLFNYFRELGQHFELLFMLSRRDVVSLYKQTILGPLWYLISPILTSLTYAFIFGEIAKISTDGLPRILFYYSGTIIWNYFATCINNAADIFIANYGLLGKAYFPRLVLPLSKAVSNLFTLGIQLLVLIIIYIVYLIIGIDAKFSIYIIIFPLIILQLSLLSIGFGLIVSSITTKYRDLRQLVLFGLNLWMFLTPIVYPSSNVKGILKISLIINPVAPLIEMSRIALFNKGYVSALSVLVSISLTIIIVVLGVYVFRNSERNFIDII